MAPKRGKAAGKATSKLTAHNFLPTLSKPAEVIGEYIKMQGKDWKGCPAADKDKWYRCVVRAFEAMHNFGAFKSAAFEVQEMGESAGEGSLEPGGCFGREVLGCVPAALPQVFLCGAGRITCMDPRPRSVMQESPGRVMHKTSRRILWCGVLMISTHTHE